MKKVLTFALLLFMAIRGFSQENTIEPPMDGFYSIIIYENNAYDGETKTFFTLTDDIFVLIDNDAETMTVGIDFNGDGDVTDEEVTFMGIDYLDVDNGFAATAQDRDGQFVMYFNKVDSSYGLVITMKDADRYIGVPMRYVSE